MVRGAAGDSMRPSISGVPRTGGPIITPASFSVQRRRPFPDKGMQATRRSSPPSEERIFANTRRAASGSNRGSELQVAGRYS